MNNDNLKKYNCHFFIIFIRFFIFLSLKQLLIVKAQEITRIIWIGDKDFGYVSFANYSNGDMVVETTSNQASSKRMFYGLKQNGEYFFDGNGIPTPFYSLNAENIEKYETEIVATKVGSTNKEYLVSISKNNEYCELYDFEGNTTSEVKASDFLGVQTILGNANAFLTNYIIYAFWSDKTLKIKKLYFGSTNINEVEIKASYEKSFSGKTLGYHISCFQTEFSFILTCLTLYQKSSSSSQFYMIALNESSLVELGTGSFTSSGFYPNSFYKCVNLKSNVGAFIYYAKNGALISPYIALYYFTRSSNSVIEYAAAIAIKYNNIQFSTDLSLNDVIRISSKRVCFMATSEDKTILYIVLIDISDNLGLFKYYQINLYSSYNYKILSDLKGHLFNNMVSIAFSFCQDSNCNVDEDNIHYSGLIIFSYPNTTDVYINLKTKENVDINNIIIDLQNNVKIENNIFGLIYSFIQITEKINCDNILLTSTTKGSEITTNYQLDEGENIQLRFVDNIFYEINCTLKYRYIITEPEFTVFNSYPVKIVESLGSDTESNFRNQVLKYKGKTSYFIIFYGDEITEEEEEEEENKKEEEEEEREEETEIEIETEDSQKEKMIEEEEIIKEEEEAINEEEEVIKEEEEVIEVEEEISKLEEEVIKEIETIKEEEIIEEEIDKHEANKSEETDIITTIKATEITEKKTCSNDDIINGMCGDGSMKNEQVGIIYDALKDDIINGNYNGENKVIETENVIFQISTIEDQKNSLNPNISTIDLGKCEDILKSENNITEEQSLIVFKSDIKNEDLSSTVVQYEIYHPVTKKKLNLDSCKDVKIVVNVPVNLDKNTISLYDSLSESGYNLFDSEDSFYNDICATFTSENGTDMLLEDRKKEIYSSSGNISMCQEGCNFESYNKTTKKAKCNCDVQSESTETDLEKINFDKEKMGTSFLTTLKNSNFFVMKCYKLVIDFSNIIKNKGRIIMSVILIFDIAIIFVYIFKDRNGISKLIKSIINNKKKNEEKFGTPGKEKEQKEKNNKNKNSKDCKAKADNKNKEKNNKNLKEKKQKNIKNSNNSKTKNNKKNKDKNLNNNKKKEQKEKNKKNLTERKTKKNNPNIPKHPKSSINLKIRKGKNNNIMKNMSSEPPKKTNTKNKSKKLSLSNDKIYSKNSIYSEQNLSSLNKMENKKTKKQNNININIIPISNLNYSKKLKKLLSSNKSINIYNKSKMKTKSKPLKKMGSKNLNDQELNTLEYEAAIICDRRNYFQYYWSLLKKKQLILFTFIPTNDYNLFSLKLSLFLISFSLYFTINAFFFSDDTMHKIHESNGAFDIFYQIPQILYSSLISTAINMTLKLLSLSEKNIIAIKQENNINIARKKSQKIKKCIIIKFIIFFLLSLFLLLFFWYFISCFCAVFTNTQMILIKDTLVSFALSMAYPFAINLLPGMFRIPALRAKNKKIIYQISNLLALI